MKSFREAGEIAARSAVDWERRSWTRAIAAKVIATNRLGDPVKIAKANWPTDERALMIVKGAVTQTTTAGLWTYNPVIAYRSLAPSSAALALFQMGMALDLTGATTIRIPGIVPTTQPVFVAEGQPGPVVKRNLIATILGPVRKILLLATVTGELENCTPDTATACIGRMLADAVQNSIDAIAFGTTADDGVTPAGLLHGVTPTPPTAAGPDAMSQDLGNLTGAIGAAGINPVGAVFVCNPREATIIKTKVGPRFDNPILTTLGLPDNTVACFAPEGIISGYQEPPTIETGKETVLHQEDTTPADIGTAGGASAPSKSMFQTDLLAIRVRGSCAYAAVPGAAQVITDIKW